jgi:hypothetical protein
MKFHRNVLKIASLSMLSTVASITLANATIQRSLAIPACDIDPEAPICNPKPKPPQPPQQYDTVTVPGFALSYIATQINAQVQDTQLHLNNLNGDTSFIKLPSAFGGGKYPFSIPKKVVDLDCGSLCLDLGDAIFYVNDWNLNQTQVSWQSPYFILSLSFESAGREIKGYHSTLGDNGVPDVNIDNARLDVKIQPILVNGFISYKVVDTTLHGNIQATSVCDVLGIDLCNPLLGYKDMIRSTVDTQIRNRLNDPVMRQKIDAFVQPKLAQMGVPRFGTVTTSAVQASGNNLVFVYPK